MVYQALLVKLENLVSLVLKDLQGQRDLRVQPVLPGLQVDQELTEDQVFQDLLVKVAQWEKPDQEESQVKLDKTVNQEELVLQDHQAKMDEMEFQGPLVHPAHEVSQVNRGQVAIQELQDQVGHQGNKVILDNRVLKVNGAFLDQ